MLLLHSNYYRRAKIFVLNMRLKARIRELHSLSMQRTLDMQNEKIILREIGHIREALGDDFVLPLNISTAMTDGDDHRNSREQR